MSKRINELYFDAKRKQQERVFERVPPLPKISAYEVCLPPKVRLNLADIFHSGSSTKLVAFPALEVFTFCSRNSQLEITALHPDLYDPTSATTGDGWGLVTRPPSRGHNLCCGRVPNMSYQDTSPQLSLALGGVASDGEQLGDFA